MGKKHWTEIETRPLFPFLEPEIISHSARSWADAMMAAAKKRASEGQTFTIVDLMEEVGDPPGHYNKIGPTMNWIAETLCLKEIGRVASPVKSAHGRKIVIWGK